MQKIILGAALALLTFTSAQSMAQYTRTEQVRVERRMANMESVSVRKALDGLTRGDYVEQLFVDASNLYNSNASYLDIIIDNRVAKTIRLTRNMSRYTFSINMRNGDDYTRILLRARGAVYLSRFGVTINDGGWQPQPPPNQNPFTQGDFCNGSTVIHWECGQGARGAVPQGNGCYHTDTRQQCSIAPTEPFKSGEFCNGSTIIHWECGQGARGTTPQPGGCYHTDTGRRCN